MRFIAAALACALAAPAGATTPPPADAPPAEPGRAGLAAAQQHIDAAAGHFRAGAYEAALTELRAAEQITAAANDPALAQVRFNIARCYEELNRPQEALAAYEAYDKLPDDPHRKARALRAVQALEQRTFGALSVSCTQPGAVVRIPGLVEAAQPCPFSRERVPPGRYTAEATLAGQPPQSREVVVEAGAGATVSFAFAAPTFTASGVVEPPPEPIDPWPWVAFGAGAAALAAGGVLTASAIDRRDEAETLSPGGERDDVVDTFEQRRTLSYVAWGVAGAAVATGVWLLFRGDGDATTPPAASRAPLGVGFTW